MSLERLVHPGLVVNERAEALQERTMRFALRVATFCETLRTDWKGRHIADQLFRCSTGLASNYSAARRGRSHREFTAKLGTVLEESDESVFWLIFVARSGMNEGTELTGLLAEARELAAIFTASVKTAKGR